jgi:hypothetical protein
MKFQKQISYTFIAYLLVSPLIAAETDAATILNYCQDIAKKLDCADVQFSLEQGASHAQAQSYSAGSYNPFTQTIRLSNKTQYEILTSIGGPINNGVFALFHELGHHYSHKKKNLFRIALTSLFYKQWEENNADKFAIEKLCKEYGKDAISTLLYEKLSSTNNQRDVLLSLMGYLTPQEKIDYLDTIDTKEKSLADKKIDVMRLRNLRADWLAKEQETLKKGLAL